jgi:YggT family protein
MDAFIWLVDTVIRVYIWLLIASVVLSWLVAFNVVNTRHPFVNTIGRFLYQVTEPALRPIRRVVPSFGGIDISPVILALIIEFARRFLIYDVLL